jgi:hypothetical protein
MYVFILAVMVSGWEVEVDDVHHVAGTLSAMSSLDANVDSLPNVQTTSRNRSCNHDGLKARLERSERILTFTLGAIRVNRGGWEAHIVKVIVQEVGHLLGANKDQGSGRRHGDEEVVKRLLLLVLVNPENLVSVSFSITTGE